jgi:prepilin-type N-terminal cleavage/methylation domain-containing protein
VTSEPLRPSAGFTLIELSLVLLIIGVLLSLAVPRLGLLTEARLDAAADRLGSTLAYLHEEAALRGRIYRVRFDLDRESWSIAALAPMAGDEIASDFVEEWDPVAEGTSYDDGLDIVRVDTPTGSSRNGLADVYFYPETGPGEITVTLGDGDRAVELRLDAVTGYVDRKRLGDVL